MMFIPGVFARHALPLAASCALILATWAQPAQAAIVLDGTRLVVASDARSVTLGMQNTGNVPVLAQNWIDDGRQDATPAQIQVPFVLTPAIVRVEPGGSAMVRISYTREPLPADRESLFYLNVMETPPRESDADNTLMFNIRTRIKMFFRPAALRGAVGAAPSKLQWKLARNAKGRTVLEVANPTPYHVTLVGIGLWSNSGHVEAGSGMVAPFDTARFDLPAKSPSVSQKGLSVRYEIINDYGGLQAQEKRLLD